MRAVVADAEPLRREELAALLRQVASVECLAEATDGRSAAVAIDSLQPDLVFVDLDLPGLADVAGPRNVEALKVIFVAAHEPPAVACLELAAADYLLRPVRPERAARMVARVGGIAPRRCAQTPVARVLEMQGGTGAQRFFVRHGSSIVPVQFESVLCFETAGDQLVVYASDGRHAVHLRGAQLEARLDPARFVRTSPRYILNLEHVVAITPAGTERADVVMSDGESITIPLPRGQELQQRLEARLRGAVPG